ncbi:pyruvate oxidase [Bacillus testis]|uniref:pyruvate oxidase n=1 Tax=Bacillus testis TaxID=1622072 RepID=UPI00067F28E7|nr:pyruvate oxidase [Bacillus testis]
MGKMTAGMALVKTMEEWGIDHVYGMPGDSINNVVEQLRKEESNVQFIQVRHEETASLAAAAYTKMTGKIGVCLSIAGPGAVHLLNGMYDAKMDGVPMLVLAGQVESSTLGRQYFQEIKLESIFEDVSVYNQQITSAESLPDVVNQAIRTAYAKKGPAVLIIPDDIPTHKIEKETNNTSNAYSIPHIFPEERKLRMALEKIENSKRPVVLAGFGARFARQELKRFSETFGAPVIVTLPGKGALPDTDLSNLGNLGRLGTKPAYEAMEETDLLIMIGTNYPYRDYLPPNAEAIQIDLKPEVIGNRYPVNLGLIGDSRGILAWFNQHGKPTTNRTFLEACRKNMQNWWKQIEKEESNTSTPIQPEAVMPYIQKYADPNAVLSVDVGEVTVWTTRHFRAVNHTFAFSSWLATMGCGLPGAIAAKIAYPNRQAIAICGDGGFAMVMQDFITAVKYDLPITVIILNNDMLGMIKSEQAVKGHLEYAVDLQDFNFAKFAESCGGVGFRVEKYEELEGAFSMAKRAGRPVIIDVRVQEKPPLPGKILLPEAIGYSKTAMKKFFTEGSFDMPPLKKSISRLL